ncbi:MAG TPA: ATP-binding protein [Thermotogota bacterium]|nr:ATP-binding protein [Thermotogota bacterium]
MFKMPEKIVYALPEIIGNTDLFVGRKKEFDFFLGQWFLDLEKNFAQNQAIISRRKKGKTAFLQRLFNIFWSGCLTENKSITVIPFYFSIQDTPVKLGSFAENFYTQFLKCYLSYTRKEPELLALEFDLFQLEPYMDDEYIIKTYEAFQKSRKEDNWEKMWQLASRLPASVARLKNLKILQIIDEFQNINGFIYNQREETIHQMSGTYMQVAEFREAPMIVSGSEVHWLLRIVSSLTGRFQVYNLENLPEEEAKEAIERYATFRNTKINEEAKENIWRLTEGDPLYIKALFLSRFRTQTDYTIKDNIVEVYEREIEKGGEIYWTWMEYMLKTFQSVNKINSKRIMLYLFNQGQERTRDQIKKDLNLPYTDEELEEKLEALIGGDLISHGASHFDYKITEDMTYDWVFRSMYQKEIDHFVPDISKEIKRAMGKENYMKGKYQEFLIKEQFKKPFKLNEMTENGENITIHPEKIEERFFKKIGLKTYEIDLLITAKKPTKTTIYIDIKNKKDKYGKRDADRWITIVSTIKKEEPKAIFLTYSETGYTKGTKERLKENGVFILKKLKM